MERDSLVHVAATGGYGSVFEVTDGVCEVGLIDPTADEYSLRVPVSAVEEMEPAQDADRGRLLGHLALVHLRVNRRLDLARTFEVFVGADEEGGLELWFGSGTSRPARVSVLSPGERDSLTDALGALALDGWAAGGPVGAPADLGGWGWSLQMVGGGLGQAAYGRAAAGEAGSAGVPAGLRDLVGTLAALGLPVAWQNDGPAALPDETPLGDAASGGAR